MNGSFSHRDNPLNWSFPFGRAFGIRLRTHLFFILFIIIELFRAESGTRIVSAVILALLFGVVLLHEFGHCFGARYVGGDAEQILMWPLGGLATVDAPRKPGPQFIVTAAGPAVNVLLCGICGLALLVVSGFGTIPFNPFDLFGVPADIGRWTAGHWLITLWSINYMLLLFNLLPVFPLDGGRLLQAMLWKSKGFGRATMIATYVGMVGAIAIATLGMITSNTMLFCVAAFGFITCYFERQHLKSGMMQDESEFGYDFSRGFGAFETNQESGPPSWYQRRRQEKMARKAEEERLLQQEIEHQIDAILTKVHEQGIQSLSPKEKKLLHRETERKKET